MYMHGPWANFYYEIIIIFFVKAKHDGVINAHKINND